VSSGALAAVLSGLATSLGALPFLFVRDLARRTYDGILGLGAGLMLAAATLGLLAEAVHGVHGASGLDVTKLALVVAGFVAGVGLAAAMDRFIPHHHAGGHHQHLGHEPGHDVHDPPERHAADDDERRRAARHAYAVVGALSLHRVPEGLAIGAGFAVPGASRIGIILAIAVGVQNACEGIVMSAPLRASGVSPRRGFVIVALTGLTIPIAAAIGQVLAGVAAVTMPFVLALAGGTLIYVTSNEIIPESHSHGNEGTASAGLAIGFLLTMLLEAVLF
jgi:ZIP family zinc transporter